MQICRYNAKVVKLDTLHPKKLNLNAKVTKSRILTLNTAEKAAVRLVSATFTKCKVPR